MLLIIKMLQLKKRVNVRFFHENYETLKKIFFIKVLQNGKNLSASIHFHGGNNWKRSFLTIKLTHLYQAENVIIINTNCYVKIIFPNGNKWKRCTYLHDL